MIANPFRMAMLAAPVLAALAFGARADIFTWVDESGTVNFTNEAPPEGVQARTVAHDNPAPPVVAAEQREAQSKAEVRALSDRIHRLEADAAAASASAPSAPPPFVSPLPVPGYAVAPSPPERLSYAFSGPSVESACSPS